MNANERKIKIIKTLNKKGKVQINELAEDFGATKVTIRSNLDSLEKRGLLLRAHGGAVFPENHHFIRLIAQTIIEKRREKEAIYGSYM